MTTTPAQSERYRFVLVLALIALSLAVFNWGLQYKMSLYNTNPHTAQTPAKLWVGKTSGSASAAEIQNQQVPPTMAVTALLIFGLLLYSKPETWLRSRPTPWKPKVDPALPAFAFRPPPALAQPLL